MQLMEAPWSFFQWASDIQIAIEYVRRFGLVAFRKSSHKWFEVLVVDAY